MVPVQVPVPVVLLDTLERSYLHYTRIIMAGLNIDFVTYIMKNQFNIYSGKTTNFVAISIYRPRTQ